MLITTSYVNKYNYLSLTNGSLLSNVTGFLKALKKSLEPALLKYKMGTNALYRSAVYLSQSSTGCIVT